VLLLLPLLVLRDGSLNPLLHRLLLLLLLPVVQLRPGWRWRPLLLSNVVAADVDA
jgi:hypothetical protein